jgi:uncharacterized membrane protein HdeD (DUF308 family)
MELLKKVKINYLIEAIVMIVIGIVLIVWTGDSIRLFARILAALLVIVGAAAVIGYLIHRDKRKLSYAGFVMGIIIAALGIWIFFNPDTFTDFVPKLFGIFIIASGLVNLGQTFSLARSNYDYWSVSLVFAVITIGMGVVLLAEPSFVKKFLVTLIGIFLVYDGATNLWTIFKVGKFVKEKVQEETAIDAEAVIVEESAIIDGKDNTTEETVQNEIK